jgi:PhzF family phenazine biosynthesis protein
MPQLPYYEIHAFADTARPLSGNPAGVCLMDAFPDNAVLTGIAESNNLSETAFLVPLGEDLWHLRWFTPSVEVDLCGHATFAAGALVLETGKVRGETAKFDTRSGRLEVRRDRAGFAMDLPAIGYRPAETSTALEAAMGLETAPQAVFDIDRIHGAIYQMWVMEDEAAVKLAEPDHAQLKRLNTNIILTAPGREVDFVSRFFAPASGVDEDPVTGSAHCSLAPYWAKRLDKPRLSARQIGPRPGALEVEPKFGRVALYGHALRYLDGSISV